MKLIRQVLKYLANHSSDSNLRKEVKRFVYDLRINAQVEVVELDQAAIATYVS